MRQKSGEKQSRGLETRSQTNLDNTEENTHNDSVRTHEVITLERQNSPKDTRRQWEGRKGGVSATVS